MTRHRDEPTPADVGDQIRRLLALDPQGSFRDGVISFVSGVHRNAYNGRFGGATSEGFQLALSLQSLLNAELEPAVPDLGVPGQEVADAPEVVVDAGHDLRSTLLAMVDDTMALRHTKERPGDIDTASLWEWLHLQFLRLPRDQATLWRKEAAMVGQIEPDHTRLVPPCPAADHTGWNGDRELLEQFGHELGRDRLQEYEALLRPLAAVLSVLHRSDDLISGHKNDALTTDVPLSDPAERDAYRQLALRRVRHLGPHRAPDGPRVAALVECDECTRSVLPWPRPAADSWWADRCQDSRSALELLVKQFGVALDFVDAGQYVEHLKDRATIITTRFGESEPGRVLWTLKAGVLSGGQRELGRVLVGNRP